MKNKGVKIWLCIVQSILVFISANCLLPIRAAENGWLAAVAVVLFIAANVLPIIISPSVTKGARLRVCFHGVACLKAFAVSCVLSVIYHFAIIRLLFSGSWALWLWSALICVLAHTVLFWNGMICSYCASVQLGIRHRAIGLLCGFIPIANLIMLYKIITVVSAEVEFETEKARINDERKADKICETKYPILLVHGVFFRDFKYLNYWGRIPKELETNGATVFYGNHQSALSVADSGKELYDRIKEIVEQTGCQKVNIIAHSKGGLDCRYAMDKCGAKPLIASLTTINTPHRGCGFADWLLEKVPLSVQQRIADTYNAALKKLGDSAPDFMSAVRDLTAKGCGEIDFGAENTEEVLCQSVGSVLKRATGGKFPLNCTYHLVNYFDGENDGLVSEKSFCWGDSYRLLKTGGQRGISHGDMIDLNRENIPDFDVREFYVELVSDLKQRGL